MPAKSQPRHIAFIMDGNGRWATHRGRPRLEGHRQGIEALKRVCDWLIANQIPYATFYAFSTENWARPQDEVSGLFNLMRLYFKQEMATLHKKGVKVKFIGNRTPAKLDADIIQLMVDVEAQTANNTALTALFAINYSGRDELVRATQAIAHQIQDATLQPEAITPDVLASHLDTAGLPDPDMMVRTSGELRLSNFMLWQMAYAEFYFGDVLWPDVTDAHLNAALDAYMGRDRRFGGLTQATP